VEFVSVNPNGPITIGSGRGAAFGSTLCNVLEAAGNEVHREYYVNDGVNSEQMRLFAESVKAICNGEAVPDNGYKGDYVHAVAERIKELVTFPKQNFGSARVRSMNEDEEGLQSRLLHEMGQAKRVARNQLIDRLFDAHDAGTDVANTLRSLATDDYKLLAEAEMIAKQESDLSSFGITFDKWYYEQGLHDSGQVNVDLEQLKQQGVADEKPYRVKLKMAKGGVIEEVIKEEQVADEDDVTGEKPTLWLRSTLLGDDQDRVLRRRDGRPTYIASDLSYHINKFSRPKNADKLITVVGPDHHGYIARLTAVVAAHFMPHVTPGGGKPEGINGELFDSQAEKDAADKALAIAKEKLQVAMFQIVRFMKDGKPAPMRKRDGNIYALIDLINEIGLAAAPDKDVTEQQRIGRDVARFFYLMRSHETAMDFDLDLATKQSDENPVFYVQYAHARISSIIQKALEQGLASSGVAGLESHLQDPREHALMKKILDLPHEIARAADDQGVHRLATYATELARAFHYFYDGCRVIQPENPELTAVRLGLCDATKKTLARTFQLLGISAPEQM